MELKKASLFYEKKVWKRGIKFVAGLDEVGRGAFAGPVVAAAVVLSKGLKLKFPIFDEKGREVIIADSKKLKPRQREIACSWIKKKFFWGVGVCGASFIDKVGMRAASRIAFRKALSQVNKKLGRAKVEFLFLDAFYVPFVRGLPRKNSKLKGVKGRREALAILNSASRQLAIINGDQKCFSIASASIVAKVFRDKLMLKLSKNSRYKVYDWGKNKGYGTKTHIYAIKKYGITKQHRKTFLKTFLAKTFSSP